MKMLTVAATALALAAGAARAEVTDKSSAGFEVTEKASIAATPAKVWDGLMHPARWWSPKHTWSGDAKNLSFDPSGCFCERLKKGAGRYLTSAEVDGATQLRLFGSLGPLLFSGASGLMGFT